MKFTVALLAAVLLSGEVRAELQTKTIPYEHAGTQLEGYLVWDDEHEGKRPGVLVVHEWWGLNDYARQRADQLAELGYVAFAVDMYGKGKLTEHPQQAQEWASQVRANVDQWRERAQRGLEILKEHENVDAERLAAIGYCFGGSTVLQLAFTGAELDGVVSFHGALQVPEPQQARAIKAGILVCHGAEDTFIPEDVAQKFRTALNEADVDWTMIYYGNAQHSFTVLGADEKNVPGIKYNERADERSWKHMQIFLTNCFE